MSKKSIYFRLKLKGRGIVNYDSSEQAYLLNKLGLNHLVTMSNGRINSNVNYAKKRFFEVDGKPNYKLAISPFCLGKGIYNNEIDITTTSVGNNDELFVPYIASPATLLRGYMQTNGKNTQTWIRKSPITLPEAIQTNGAISSLEIDTKSGERTDTSMFYKEVIGDVEYETCGGINLQELQFCSVDPIHGRAMFNEDLFEIYKKTLKYHLPTFDSELGYYTGKNSVVKIPERGFILSNEVIVELVKFYFERLLNLKITRSKSFVETYSLEYKLVENPVSTLLEDEHDWVKIETIDDINKINFEVENFYSKFDENEAESLRAELVSLAQTKKDEKNASKNKKASKTNDSETE